VITKKQILLSIILSFIGLAVWITINNISGTVEAWDSKYYYLPGLPIMFAASALAGYIEPQRVWIWGISIVILQPVALLIQSDAGPLVVVGLSLFAIIILLATVCAYLGKVVRIYSKRLARNEDM
jgi:hypothetical protein